MSRPSLRDVVPYTSDYLSCETECVAAVLKYLGLEPLCLLYGKDWAFFHYCIPEAEGADLLLSSWRRPEEDFWAEHGVKLRVRATRNPERAWRGVKALLDRQLPAVVLVDPFYLPHSSGYAIRHSLHFLIVNGYDPASREVYVADGLFQYRGPLPFSVLAEARAGGGDGYRPDNKWIEIDPPSGPAPGLASLVARALDRNLRAMVGPRPPALSRLMRASLERWGAVRLGVGLSGIRGFARRLVEAPPPAGRLDALYNQTMAVGEKRAWHSQFLVYAGETLRLPGLVEAGRVLEPLAQSWSVVRALFFKAARGDPAAEILRRVQKRLYDIADLEERALEIVARAQRGLAG
ncbi:MAG: BtrH N-terminal domain-containing protein [Acetobacteraceae bacterium]|nr:BtrH N-terminal domain-containing protein [Acetobacteraceae bacterium]